MRYFILLIFIFLLGCETTKSVTKSKKVSVNEIIENRKIEKNFTKKELYDALGFRYVLDNPFTHAASSFRDLEHDVEIISGVGQNIFFVFEFVSEPVDCGVFKCDQGNGTLASWHNSFDKALASIPKKELTYTKKLEQKSTTTTAANTSQSTKNTSSGSYDSTKYFICYGEMTRAHKKRGFHQKNRSASIAVKEAVCKAYAKGEDLNYEGKGQ